MGRIRRNGSDLNNTDTIPSTDTAGVNTETPTTRRTRPKRIIRYDSEMYDLPKVEEKESLTTHRAPTSSKELIKWKGIAIVHSLTVLLGIAAVVRVVIYFDPLLQGW